MGEADDLPIRKRLFLLGEVYSGEDDEDKTPENIKGRDARTLMRSGWSNEVLIAPMSGEYFSFSVEEASTISES